MQSEYTMLELIDVLNKATEEYDKGTPTMTDEEWDNLYFSLQYAEQSTGVIFEHSPTQRIIYNVQNELTKVKHNHPMLSLAKTKDIQEVVDFLQDKLHTAMCKMDGLTCSLLYEDGRLVRAETRGDGMEGEDITHNAMVIPSIPKRIPNKEKLVIDGEIICKKDVFENNFADEYKNPRNFAAGSIRLLDPKECEKRQLTFVAWEVIEGLADVRYLSYRFYEIEKYGFTVVPYITSLHIDSAELTAVKFMADQNKYPIDGIVFKFEDIEYGQSLGATEHHFKNAIAYKFYDETTSSKIKNIEWTMGRTGILTPVAVFDPIEIDGSIVERASLHNVSVMKKTLGQMPWVGQKVEVYKANMIIPQIASAEADDETTKEYLDIPHSCPICGGALEVRQSDGGTFNLECLNPACGGKLVNRIDHFCGKKGLDIKGLSIATLNKLIDWGWLNSTVDIFKLSEHRQEWIDKPGFGAKSVDNILNAIENSKNTTLEHFICSIGIPLIGKTVSKELVKVAKTYDEFRKLITDKYDFSQLEGFADSKTEALLTFDYSEADEVYKYMSLEPVVEDNTKTQQLEGKVFVITGKLNNYKNRAELVARIEQAGGKVAASISKNTDYLINNDIESASSKNVAAKKLGIPIISESQLEEMI